MRRYCQLLRGSLEESSNTKLMTWLWKLVKHGSLKKNQYNYYLDKNWKIKKIIRKNH
jgi:hypothetical protein